jgi:hypothetical protein
MTLLDCTHSLLSHHSLVLPLGDVHEAVARGFAEFAIAKQEMESTS